MDTTITLNLNEAEFKALTVVCKALKTTPEQVVRASAKKLFENPMDFMFEAFTNENMGFQVSEGQPTQKINPELKETRKAVTEKKTAVITQGHTVVKAGERVISEHKPEPMSEPEPRTPPKVVEKLPSMGTAQFREHHDEIVKVIGDTPGILIKDVLCHVLDISKYDYVGSDKTFRYYLDGLKDKGEIILENKEGLRCYLPKDVPVAPKKGNPLTGAIILKANGKYRKIFYEAIAKSDSKVMTDADFKALFDGEGYDEESIIPAIDEAFQTLATKGLVHFSGKKGGNITIPEKFRYKIWKTYPELKAHFSTN